MIDYRKYITDEDDLKFLKDLRILLEESQLPITLDCCGCEFHVDPCNGGAQIWQYGEKIAEYNSIDDIFLNFTINGKPFIECISEIDYASETPSIKK